MCNFIEWKADKKIVYKRYASLFFICCVDSTDNELITCVFNFSRDPSGRNRSAFLGSR